MSRRAYEGPAIDGTYQHIAERAFGDPDGETVDATPTAGAGEETVEDVPIADGGRDQPDVDGQSTWDDWGWSA